MSDWENIAKKLEKVAATAAKKAKGNLMLSFSVLVDADGKPVDVIGPNWQRTSEEQWQDIKSATEPPDSDEDDLRQIVYEMKLRQEERERDAERERYQRIRRER